MKYYKYTSVFGSNYTNLHGNNILLCDSSHGCGTQIESAHGEAIDHVGFHMHNNSITIK